MPFIQVNLSRGRTPEQKRELVLGLSRAAADALGVSEYSVRVWIVEVSPDEVAAGGEILSERNRVPQPSGDVG
jgi:4-oxalocrotonate tautomerase